MTLKEYLARFSGTKKAIDSAEVMIQHYEGLGARSKPYRSLSKGNYYGLSSVESVVEKIEKAKQRVLDSIELHVDSLNSISELIGKLENPEHRAIMERYYIIGQTWEKIADECFVSLRTAHYIHKKALAELEPVFAEMQVN